jgi:SOS response regulatory protein OraA/RecX
MSFQGRFNKNSRPYKARDIEKCADPKRALNRIQYYLTRRDHSAKELETKLNRYFTPEAFAEAMAKANELRWLRPPEVLSEQFANSLRKRKKSHRQIQQTLKTKGLTAAKVDMDEELTAARAVAQKWTRLEPEAVARRLAQRGFASSIVRQLLTELRVAAKESFE